MIPFLASLVSRRQWGMNPGAPANLISFLNQLEFRQRALSTSRYIERRRANWDVENGYTR